MPGLNTCVCVATSLMCDEHSLDALNSELDGLKRERKAMAQQSEASKNAVEEVTTKYEKELARLSALQRRQAELSASAQAQRDAARRQELEQVRSDAAAARAERDAMKKKLHTVRTEREKAEVRPCCGGGHRQWCWCWGW